MTDIIDYSGKPTRPSKIHHLALLMVKDYITILVGMLQRIHRQYINMNQH